MKIVYLDNFVILFLIIIVSSVCKSEFILFYVVGQMVQTACLEMNTADRLARD